MSLRIAQISDIHIGPEANGFRGFPVRQNFLKVLGEVCRWKPDILVLSGDLAADLGEREAYLWLREQLKGLPFTCYLMAGNHDDTRTMREVFSLEDKFIGDLLYYRADHGDAILAFWDTSSHHLPLEQLDWLEDVSRLENREVLLFIHHPPLPMGCRFMDETYPLKNREAVWERLKNIPQISHVFCGHYHYGRTVYADGKSVHLCPSTMMQLDPASEGFGVFSPDPGWLQIYWDSGALRLESQYVKAAVVPDDL